MNQIPKLRFRTTREIYQSFRTSYPVINFFVYGFLYWVEDHVVDFKTKSALDEAIIDYENELSEDTGKPWEPPVATEEYESADMPLPVLKSSYPWVEKKKKETS